MVDDKAVSSSQLIQSYKKVKTDEEYAHEVFHCVEKGCSLNETKDELLGEIERIYPMIGDRVAMHYNKALIDKLNQLSIFGMSSRCLKKNPSFFELIAEKNLEEDNLFWLYLMVFENRDINNTSNGHLEKQLQCLPDKEQKSLFSFWTTRLERLLPYFAPQTAEKELVRTIKVWLSSENFTEENDKKWTHLIQNSSNSINLEQLKKVVWTKESTREYLEFAHALENIQISTLTVDTATKLYTYLHDIFTLQVTLSENAFGAVLTVSKKILFLSDSNEAMTKIRDKIAQAKWNIYEIRIYGCKLLVLNCDFEQKRFHGMNLILGASVLVVKTKLLIDLSGDSHNPKLRDPAPSALGNDGMPGSDGTDGKPGESSGNLFLFVNRIVNSDLLSILLNGGTGQSGQDGGNGAKGSSGKRVTKAELEGLMPKYTSLYLAEDSYMINFVPDGFTLCGKPESENRLWNAWVYNSFTNEDGRRIEYSFSGNNSVTWNIYDIYFVIYGTVGSPGGAGGKNGLGGEGGKAGNLTAISMNTGKAIPIRHTKPVDGTVGCHGRCGGSGESGTDGNDMAMIDRSRGSNNNKFFPGEAGHSKLRAVFYSTDQTTSRTRLNGFYKFRRKEKKHYCGFEEVEIEPIPKTEETQKRDESDRNSDSKAVSKEAISQEEIINEFKTNFVGVDIDFIVEDIIIETGGNKVEDIVEENEVKEEISVVRTQVENVSHHETNLRKMQITTESVVKMIEDENWERIVYPTVLEAEKWISVLSNVLQVSLNMNDHREAITTMLTRIKHLRDEKKGGNIFPGLLQLEADIEEKMRLSGHEYKRKHTQNDPRNPSKIQPIEQELFDVACGTQWVHDSAETRRDLVDKMESEAATFGAEHELLLALYDIYGYLDQHQELFKKYYAEINWSDYGQVKAHLKESLSETEQQAMEERTNKVINALDNDISRLASKLWETYSGSAFRDIDKLLSDEHGIETTKVFSSLNKMIFDSSHMSERFTFEYDMYGNLKPVGTTATSLIHIYFFSKQILEFNMKMHRYREKASVKDWIVEDIRQRQSLRESLEMFRATINNYGYESPSKSFFDDLRKNGATSSAYRLLVAEEMNVNVQVYSQHGFAKVKLVENNNSNATEKHYLILNTAGEVFKAVSNEKVRILRNLINSHEPELLLSEEVDLSQFVVPAFHAQITEWSDAVNASTNSTRFLKFLRRLFELRGCSETLTELQFAITTFIEAVCNFGISEDQMCRYLLGEHGCLRKWSLPLRLIVAVKNCSLTLEEISNMLEPIVDSRLRALFGAKLQGKKVESEDISKIVQLLTHSKDCFSELEHRSLSEWIDIAKCQQWGNYDHLMQSYGSIGYYFVLLESAQGQGPKEASEKLKTVLNRVPQPRILLEKVVSRLTSLILYKDIEFDNICQDSLCNLLRTISTVAGDFVESNAMILAITHGKTQNQVMDTVRKSHSKCLDSIFPSKERTFSDLLRITYPGSESEQFSSFVETVLNGGNRTEEVIKFLDQIDTALFEWTCSNEGKAKKLRDTQKLAVLSAFFHDKNLLAQINTGEGKSFIIAALSILKILAGGPMTHVDIITSSSVLAIRDSEALKPFYARFNITVGHNCHTNVEKRKGAYKCNIVYGDITQFERDYLLHAYYKKNILGSRKQEHVIVDESDSMCLDHGNNMLYLSHVVPGLDLLESLFVFIHKEVYSNRTTDKLASMTSALRKQILSDLFGTVTKDDIAKLVDEQDSSQINAIWRILSRCKVIGEDGILLDRPSEEMQAFATEMKSNFGETVTMSLLAIIHIVEHRKREIIVPEYLKPYILLHLDEFINNAFKGLFLKNKDEFIVDLDRNNTGSDLHPGVTIIDKGTGTSMANSQWSEGLHQFLQLKHGCRLSPISLKAVFISNVTYLKKYSQINGFSGTLGSDEESRSLRELYNADVIRIPSWKPKDFYEKVPVLCPTSAFWIETIAKNFLEAAVEEKRSVLIICQSIDSVENLKENLLSYMEKEMPQYAQLIKAAILYTRDYEEFDFESGGLKPGQLILSTNLAGRGSDIILSEELKTNGGLHVVITFLPENSRIEAQAFGRSARSGDPGSGQIICLNDKSSRGAKNIFQLKQFRDNTELHRLQSLKKIYDFRIDVEETCLRRFQDHCSDALKEVSVLKEDELPSIQQIIYFSLLDEWALWLDGQAENIKLCEKSANEGQKRHIFAMAENFLKEHPLPKNNNMTEVLHSIKWIKAPQPLINIALSLISMNHKILALSFFDMVLTTYPDYSAEALYYKGILAQQGIRQYKKFKQEIVFETKMDYITRPVPIALTGAKNYLFEIMQKYGTLEELPDYLVDYDEKCTMEAMDLLIRSRSAFMAKITEKRRLNDVVQILKQSTNQHLLSRGYEVQHEECIAVFETVIGNIEDIVGHTVTISDFSLETDDYNRMFARRRDCQQLGFISPVVLTTQLSISKLHQPASMNAIPVQMLYQYLNWIQNTQEKAFDGQKLMDVKSLETLPLPSVNGFWECLRTSGCFISERYFIAINRWRKNIPAIPFKETKLQVGPFDLLKESRNLENYVYFECTMGQINDAAVEAQVVEAMESGQAYVEIIGTLNLPMLEQTKTLSKFDYITKDTVMIELGVMEVEAQWILKRMVKERILSKIKARIGTDSMEVFILTNSLDLSMFPKNIQPAIELLFNRHFCYGYALKCIKSTVKRCLNGEDVKHKILLPLNPYKDLYHSLISHGILVDNRVTEYFTDYFEEYEHDMNPSKKVKGISPELYDRLRNKSPWIKVNSCKLRSSPDYFREKNVPTSPEIRRLFTNGMRQMAYIEKANKWKWYFGVFTIALLIICPLFVNPIIGVVIFAVVGSGLYFMNMFSENRKHFAKFEADEHEEISVLLSSHEVAVNYSKQYAARLDEIENFQRRKNKFIAALRKFVLGHAATNVHFTDCKETVDECFDKSQILPDLKKFLDCHIVIHIKHHLKNDTALFEAEVLDPIVSFVATIVTDINKLIPATKRYTGKHYEPSLNKSELLAVANGKQLPANVDGDFNSKLHVVLGRIFDDIVETKGEQLCNEFLAVRRASLSTDILSNGPDKEFLQNKSCQYSAERLFQDQKSDFMNEDLHSVFLKMCFTDIKPRVLAHMIKYNYPMSAHSASLLFKGVIHLFTERGFLFNDYKFVLQRSRQPIYTFEAKNLAMLGKPLRITIQLNDNLFTITLPEKSGSIHNEASGLYEALSAEHEPFASWYALAVDAFQADLSRRVTELPSNFTSLWNIKESWHSNEKLIPPVAF